MFVLVNYGENMCFWCLDLSYVLILITMYDSVVLD